MQGRRNRGSWIILGSGLLMAVGPVAGCGQSDGGDANSNQQFEKPAGAIPDPKIKPSPKASRDLNDLSPRERRELRQAK